VQGLNKWQAQCYTATAATVSAAWGDNLTGDAKLSVGSPIRVELGLFDAELSVPLLEGYTVVKLDPNALHEQPPMPGLAISASTWPAARSTITKADVSGSTAFGVYNYGGNVTITHSRIHGIPGNGSSCSTGVGGTCGGMGGPDPNQSRGYTGCPHGTGILFVGKGSQGPITNTVVSGFGRCGISISGSGAHRSPTIL
jgi:hypothetical protein